MASRYNPPPNWPAPPAGWTPPPGWQPDSSWGPAPEGWQVWQDHVAPISALVAAAAVGSSRRPHLRPWAWPAVAGVALLTGIGIGAASAAGDAATAPSVSGSASSRSSEPGPTTTVTQEVAGPVTTETVTAKPAGPENVIEEGQWEVGVDIKAGTYKLIEPVTGDCYWKISPTGKPDDIVNNDIVTGGRPTVILKKGQDFTNEGCGTWGKR